MWTCNNCHEAIEDQFEACWSCGCSREGKLNLEFVQEPSLDDQDPPFSSEIQKHFVCRRCGHKEARCRTVTAGGVGVFRIAAEQFLAVSCYECGLTEFFSLSVLEQRSDVGNFLRGLFGGW